MAKQSLKAFWALGILGLLVELEDGTIENDNRLEELRELRQSLKE